jgi:uncharacterized protein YndB with AHSA1/START domain
MCARNGHDEAIEVSVEIAATPTTVWRCLVEGDLLARWLAADVALEPRVGGALRIDFTRYETIVEGTVQELHAPERLVLTWGVSRGSRKDAMPAGSTTVEFHLQPLGGGTRLTLRHRGLPGERDRRDHVAGWTEYLASLASVAPAAGIEGGVDALWDAWFAAWSETDAARRDELLAACVASDVRFRDFHTDGSGRAWISAWIATCQHRFPGTKLAREGRSLQTRDAVLVRWQASTPDGHVIGRGINHGRLSAEGRLASVEGFWEG